MTVRIEMYRTPHRRWCIFDCPKRPGNECKVMLKPWPITDGKTWEMTGSEDAPTLSPSIDCQKCGWHGFIQNGHTVPA
jgi:hypothetical protein